MKKIYTVAKYAKSIMLAAVMTASALTTVNAQEADNTTYAPAEANSRWRGEEVTGEKQQVYVYNVGAGIFVTTDDTPSEKNIDNAALWTLSNNQFSYGDYHINMWSNLNAGVIWDTAINTAKATTYKVIAGNTEDRGLSYKLSKTDGRVISHTRYFNVDNNEYTAAKTKSEFNDWLFISETQKNAYLDYKAKYNEAKNYASNEKVEANVTLFAKLKEILSDKAKATYASYEGENGDQMVLSNIIEEIKTYLNSTPTGIDNINATSSAKAEAIFSVNGVRNAQLNKGLNIVKMSDGSVKKIMIK